jgi:hypothetical protein
MATLCLQGKGTVLGMDGIGGMGIGTVMSAPVNCILSVLVL